MLADSIDRYSRQIRFAPIGVEGQARLAESLVAIVGCGALGSFHAAALARAGVGRLRIIDRDYVEWNNLQRQWLFEEDDAARALPKAIAAKQRLARINSTVDVEAEVADLTARNAEDLLAGAALLLDATDNFETRFLVNDYAVREGTPWIYGAAVGSYGLVMTVLPGRTPCLRCVYPDPPEGVQPTCETAGVVNTTTSTIASLQVSRALRLLVEGPSAATAGGITTVDVWSGLIRQIDPPDRDAACPCCSLHQFEWLSERRRAPVSLCGRNAVQIHERQRPLDLGELEGQLAQSGTAKSNGFALRFVPADSPIQCEGGCEMTIFPDGRAIIKGTTDPGLARSLYARYIGA